MGEKIKIVKASSKEGLSIDIIAKITELTTEEVEEILVSKDKE